MTAGSEVMVALNLAACEVNGGLIDLKHEFPANRYSGHFFAGVICLGSTLFLRADQK
jgi:hypothetical protein